MGRAAFSYFRLSNLAVDTKNMDPNAYCGVVEDYSLEFAAVNYREQFLFQKNNAAVRGSTYKLSPLAGRNIEVMKWPSGSPNLKPIENVWLLARKVYRSGKQCIDNATERLIFTIHYRKWNWKRLATR